MNDASWPTRTATRLLIQSTPSRARNVHTTTLMAWTPTALRMLLRAPLSLRERRLPPVLLVRPRQAVARQVVLMVVGRRHLVAARLVVFIVVRRRRLMVLLFMVRQVVLMVVGRLRLVVERLVVLLAAAQRLPVAARLVTLIVVGRCLLVVLMGVAPLAVRMVGALLVVLVVVGRWRLVAAWRGHSVFSALVSAVRRVGLESPARGRSLPAGRLRAGAHPGINTGTRPPARCTRGGVASRLMTAALCSATRRGPAPGHAATLLRTLGSTTRRDSFLSLSAALRAPDVFTTGLV